MAVVGIPAGNCANWRSGNPLAESILYCRHGHRMRIRGLHPGIKLIGPTKLRGGEGWDALSSKKIIIPKCTYLNVKKLFLRKFR